jgi:hypothetical protein
MVESTALLSPFRDGASNEDRPRIDADKTDGVAVITGIETDKSKTPDHVSAE